PDLASRESIMLYDLQSDGRLPKGDYGLAESYGDDPDCDCRRVSIAVVSRHDKATTWATISYGWEEPAFYNDQAKDGDGNAIKGPALIPDEPQSEHADYLLEVFQQKVLNAHTIDQFKRHYRLFKDALPRKRPSSRSAQDVGDAQERRKRRRAIKKAKRKGKKG
ncbi:MAG: hypothetical protein AAFX99_26170, partial [Myxococcota bacterium]